ncbi:MAG: D-alanine--D-alanine ligase [Verrucomicrobiales bacterium]
MNRRLKIAVFRGGPSAEREVSLRTGAAVAQAFRNNGHDVTEVDPLPGQWSLPSGTEVVFLALHGTYGEDGGVQKELERLGVPYTGCDPEASRIAFDKALTKECCLAQGIPTAPYKVINSAQTPWDDQFPLPAILKPLRQGSSVGLQFINSPSDWPGAVVEALKYDTELLLEERIIGRETTVGILDGEALPVVEVRPKIGVYDYTNKYTSGATEYFCPADFAPGVAKAIQEAALGAFHAVGGRDYARVDVMVRQTGEPVVLEVNTLPGMTETSLLPKAAAAAGLSYGQLCEKMISLALARSTT